MKGLLHYIGYGAIGIFLMVWTFTAFAFVNWQLDPSLWTIGNRLFYICLSTCFMFGTTVTAVGRKQGWL